MSQYKVDIALIRGTTKRETFTWKPAGVPADLTGCTATLDIRLRPEDANLASLSTADHITLGGTAGTITVFFPLAVSNLSFNLARYRLLITHPNGEVTPLIGGTISCKSGFE